MSKINACIVFNVIATFGVLIAIITLAALPMTSHAFLPNTKMIIKPPQQQQQQQYKLYLSSSSSSSPSLFPQMNVGWARKKKNHYPSIKMVSETTTAAAAATTTTTVLSSNKNDETTTTTATTTMKKQQQQPQNETDDLTLVWKYLLDRFQGDFDNYRQVVQDRNKNLLPREGGGHENFHCTLIPVSETGRLAAFYFDGNPQRIFRFRYYELLMPQEDQQASTTTTTTTRMSNNNTDSNSSSSSSDNNANGNKSGIEMRLYTLHPDLEALLRSHSEDPLQWPTIFANFKASDGSSSSGGGGGSDNADINANDDNDISSKIKYLPKCEITWSLDLDPIQHSYALSSSDGDDDDNDNDVSSMNDGKVGSDDNDDGIHAVMVHGEAIVDSTIIPGVKIRILDQLSLYDDIFYINDRGLDPNSGAFIYGNQRGVPYRLERVSSLVVDNDDVDDDNDNNDGKKRKIVDEELRWTLGAQWRSEEEYDEKLKAVGGPSVGMKRPSSSSSSKSPQHEEKKE